MKQDLFHNFFAYYLRIIILSSFLMTILLFTFIYPNILSRPEDSTLILAPQNTTGIISIDFSRFKTDKPLDMKIQALLVKTMDDFFQQTFKISFQQEIFPVINKKMLVLYTADQEFIFIFQTKNNSLSLSNPIPKLTLQNLLILTSKEETILKINKINNGLLPSWSKSRISTLYNKYYSTENAITLFVNKNSLNNYQEKIQELLPIINLKNLPAKDFALALLNNEKNIFLKSNISINKLASNAKPFGNTLPINTLFSATNIELNKLLELINLPLLNNFKIDNQANLKILSTTKKERNEANNLIINQWMKQDLLITIDPFPKIDQKKVETILGKTFSQLFPQTRIKILPDGSKITENYLDYKLFSFEEKTINQEKFNYLKIPNSESEIIWQITNNKLTIANSLELINIYQENNYSTEKFLPCQEMKYYNIFVNPYYIILNKYKTDEKLSNLSLFLSEFTNVFINENQVCLVK